MCVQFGENTYKYQPLPIQGSPERHSRLLWATPVGDTPRLKEHHSLLSDFSVF